MKRIILGISILFIFQFSYAADDYKCVIERIDGIDYHSEPLRESREKLFVGKEFSISRSTGILTGAFNHQVQPKITSQGDEENPFIVVSTVTPGGLVRGSSITAVVVREWIKSDKKPFVALLDSLVYFGECTHY